LKGRSVIQLIKLGRLDMAPLWPPFPDKNFKDLRIICLDGQTHGSSILLAAASSFLCHLLDSSSEKEDQVLILPETKLCSVEALLCLVHTGSANICLQNQVEDVIRLAKALQLPALTQPHNQNVEPATFTQDTALQKPTWTDDHNTNKPPEFGFSGAEKNNVIPMIQDEDAEKPSESDLYGAEKNNMEKLRTLTQNGCAENASEFSHCRAEKNNIGKMLGENETVKNIKTKGCVSKYKTSKQEGKLERPPDCMQGIIKRKWGKKTKCHQCKYCEKAFFSKAQLQDHVKKHEGSPGYCCDSCGKAFYRKDCLTIHTKSVHYGERKFTCQTCGKKFIDSYKLERHIKTHKVLTVAASKTEKKKAASVSLLKVELVDT